MAQCPENLLSEITHDGGEQLHLLFPAKYNTFVAPALATLYCRDVTRSRRHNPGDIIVRMRKVMMNTPALPKCNFDQKVEGICIVLLLPEPFFYSALHTLSCKC